MADIHIHASLVIAAGSILPPLCTAVVALRFLGIYRQKAGYGIDDWLTIPALVFAIGISAVMLHGVASRAVGYSTPRTGPDDEMLRGSPVQRTVRIIFWIVDWMQVVDLTCIKTSLIFFYRRIFRIGGGPIFHFGSLVLLFIIILWGIGLFISVLLVCPGHQSAYWSSFAERNQYCINTIPMQNALAISDVLLDFFVMLFPFPWLWRLQMSTSRKIGVTGIFMLGSASIAASILRAVTMLQATSVVPLPTSDLDLLLTGAAYWAQVECSVALISVCLPMVLGAFDIRSIIKTRKFTKKSSLRNNSESHGISFEHAPFQGHRANSSSWFIQPSPTHEGSSISTLRKSLTTNSEGQHVEVKTALFP